MNKKYVKLDLENPYCNWWLRSADSYDSSYVGYVDDLGNANSDDVDYSDSVLSSCFEI